MGLPLFLVCGATGAMCNGHRFLYLQATQATGGPRTGASRIGGGQIMVGGAAAAVATGGATTGLQRGCASKNVVSRHRRKATIHGSDLQLFVSTTSR